ncbi:DUF3306 domain-containing protein [Dinoroseobacter sp. S124A]|uniref:DUF3306 domain-containing protein n=1 Tax=Dinoroseobacter sp. S124A TaxID=3415128 RepID=UPI003C7CD42B
MSDTGDFWSRRKARVAAETEAEVAEELRSERAAEKAAMEEQPDEVVLQELGLPDPDTLQPGDDFSAFMQSAVPDRIRRRALRKLWLSNPLLANVDGLLDYGEDFTDSAMVVENMQTAYQVGKGMLKHVEEMARKEAIANGEIDPEAEAEAPPPVEMSQAIPAETPDSETETTASTTFVAEAPSEPADTVAGTDTDPGVTSSTETPPSRRRLRFQFDT